MDHQVDKSSFITLIKEGLNLQHMVIPQEFVKCLDRKSRHLILIGPSGDQWQVGWLKRKDEVYIKNGWPRFLRENMVEPHELLLFTIDGQNRFHVQIFGTNRCERLNTKRAGPTKAASTSQMIAAAKECSSFYQIFIPKLCFGKLPIPIDFVKLTHLEKMAPKEFILRNYRGRKCWFVQARVGNEICFGNGWKQFVEENCLEEGDFIICKYDGQNQMRLKIFKLYGWEKIEVENEEMNATENDYILDIKEEEEEEEEEEKEESIEEEWVMERQDDESDEESEEEHLGRGSHQRFGKALVGKRGTGGTSATKNSSIDEEKYVHPDNPRFTPTLKRNRINDLIVPKVLVEDYSLDLPQKISLLCCEHAGRKSHARKMNRMVTGEKKTWTDGRVMYRGFSRFVRINNIKIEKDKCICEFVLGKDQQIQRLEVHVVKNGLVC